MNNTKNEIKAHIVRAGFTMQDAQDASPEDIIHSVRKDVDRFASGSEQFDDITMLCLKYNGPEEKK